MRSLLIILLVHFQLGAAITEQRQKQLDSVVTNIPVQTLRHIDSLHQYIHSKATGDEERVFMFYGLFATHYKYDKERANRDRNKEYSPDYTAYRRSGVCRDFANLFKELCDRSRIPCVVALGNVDVAWFRIPRELISGSLKGPNHAWNIVKFNNSWHLMDPTWGTIERTEKYYGKDEKGRKVYLGRVKIPSRTFYDASPERFYEGRTAIHPAYFLSGTVYSYKSLKKKESRRRILESEYDFASILDSLVANKRYVYSSEFIRQTKRYSGRLASGYFLTYEWQYTDLKRSPYHKLTPAMCEEHLREFEALITYIEQENGAELTQEFEKHKLLVGKTIKRLQNKTTVI